MAKGRFLAAGIMAAFLFLCMLPSWAGTGGRGKNSTVNIQQNVTINISTAFNNLIQEFASYEAYDRCDSCPNYEGSLAGSGSRSYSYNPATNLQAAASATIAQLTNWLYNGGTAPQASEMIAFFNSQVNNYTSGTPFGTESSNPLSGMSSWALSGAESVGRVWQQYQSSSSTSFSESGSASINGSFSVPAGSNSVTLLGGNTVNGSTINLTRSASGSVSGSASGTSYTLDLQTVISPLVLDIEGNGKIEASGGNWLPHPDHLYKDRLILFDLLGDGFPMVTEWIGPHDGLLVELNPGQIRPDGTADITGSNLFGTMGGFSNGYEKLSTYDKNRDGKITGDELKGLYVWQDLNGNGKVDPGELKTVQQLGITEIEVMHNPAMQAYFVRDGKKQLLWDWYPNAMEVLKQKP